MNDIRTALVVYFSMLQFKIEETLYSIFKKDIS